MEKILCNNCIQILHKQYILQDHLEMPLLIVNRRCCLLNWNESNFLTKKLIINNTMKSLSKKSYLFQLLLDINSIILTLAINKNVNNDPMILELKNKYFSVYSTDFSDTSQFNSLLKSEKLANEVIQSYVIKQIDDEINKLYNKKISFDDGRKIKRYTSIKYYLSIGYTVKDAIIMSKNPSNDESKIIEHMIKSMSNHMLSDKYKYTCPKCKMNSEINISNVKELNGCITRCKSCQSELSLNFINNSVEVI